MMNEKDGFDKIVEALEHQNFIISRDYHIKYNSGAYRIRQCRRQKCLNVLLFIHEIGRQNIKALKTCQNEIFIKLKIKEVPTHET